ncbi:syntaxin-12-like isoform X1 [Mercenaria mercenaria]|uniref:syntaxin-12-like isoform X1 n=1 Tax=Mercenaria mercenaria TaxID=6596 RepID=UPI00234EB662|nr:syntaxin-12-like isoform X1 [Mercenaria mercenaria]
MASYGRGSFDQFSSYQDSGSSGGDDSTKLAQSVGNNIQKISQNVKQLEKLVQQIGTPQDSEEVRDRVHQVVHSTNTIAKDTNKDMQTLAHLPAPLNTQQARQFKMQKERLTEQFSDVLKNFQTVQRTAAEKERASISRARAASSSNYKQRQGPLIDFSSGFGDEPQDDQFSRPGYSQTAQVLQMENDVDLEMIQERESAIKQLESDIMDVNQIFKDLGMLVHEQGEVLDSIEANVEHATIHVEEGNKQLSAAQNYQSKARRKKCCLIVVLLVILAIVGIIIAVTVSNN